MGAGPESLKEVSRDTLPKIAYYRIFTTDRRPVKALTEAPEKAVSGSGKGNGQHHFESG